MSLVTLKSLISYKAWADTELLALLATLPSTKGEQLRTCVRTLNHIHVVDRIFRAHLSQEPRPFDATNTKETPTLEHLAGEITETDAWYVGYVAKLTEPELGEVVAFTFTDGDAGRMSREEILLHVLTHGGYHRGNVGQVNHPGFRGGRLV